MKKILCLVDFSPASEEAAHLAAAIAQRARGLLTLLHVVHIPIADTSETALMAGELLAEQKQDAQVKLNGICERIRSRLTADEVPALTLNCLVQESLLTDAVEQMSTKEGYGLIVMGKTGTGNTLEEVLIGTNTQAVFHQVRCPVLALPAEAAPTPIRKIIYASDYHDQDLAGLRETGEVATLLGAKVEVVHITDKATGSGSAESIDFGARLQQAFPGIGFEVFHAEDKEEGLLEYVRQREGQILAMLKKEGGFFTYLFRRSLTDRLASQAQLPLLIVHGREQERASVG